MYNFIFFLNVKFYIFYAVQFYIENIFSTTLIMMFDLS